MSLCKSSELCRWKRKIGKVEVEMMAQLKRNQSDFLARLQRRTEIIVLKLKATSLKAKKLLGLLSLSVWSANYSFLAILEVNTPFIQGCRGKQIRLSYLIWATRLLPSVPIFWCKHDTWKSLHISVQLTILRLCLQCKKTAAPPG